MGRPSCCALLLLPPQPLLVLLLLLADCFPLALTVDDLHRQAQLLVGLQLWLNGTDLLNQIVDGLTAHLHA